MAANGIANLRTALHQTVTYAHQHLQRLLFECLRRYKSPLYFRPAHRLADRFGVSCIVLAAIDIRSGVLRWDEHHLVTQLLKLARPMMGGSTGFHPDYKAWEASKEFVQILPAQLSPQRRLFVFV